MNEYKRVSLGRKPLRIEAPGCVVYVELIDGGTRVDVVSDGDRFSGEEVVTSVEGTALGTYRQGKRLAGKKAQSIRVENVRKVGG